MYSPAIVDQRIAQLEASPMGTVLKALPGGRLTRHPPPDCHLMTRRLAGLIDRKTGKPTRALTGDEQAFVDNERILAKIDYRYAAERYVYIIRPDEGLAPIYPLWESQTLILDALAQAEEQHWRDGNPDGLLFNILKARQLGASTLCQSFLAHRALTQSYTKCMIASDVPGNSGSTGLFGMTELTVEHWPWWLKPDEVYHTKDQHIVFANHSSVVVESGKSMKGALQDEGGSKGQIGRSKTYQVCHLSELSTWENPAQIDDSLLPAIPATRRTLGAFESTAKGRGNWWYHQWHVTMRGLGRFFNVFIPWYAEKSKYWRPAPGDWLPDAETLAYARRVEEHSERWMRRRHQLSREQLYWYWSERMAALEKGALYKFLEEYPAEPEEAFQYSGRSIFPPEVLDSVRNRARPLKALWEVRPTPLITELRTIAAEEQQLADNPHLPAARAALPPLPKKLRRLTDDPFTIPPGYGFRPLNRQELHTRGTLLDVFQVWEFPLRGYSYVISVDVGDGLGLDRSVIDVTREGTIERGEEQVAQFISDTVKPRELAFIADAIGHLYVDDDGYEAVMAVEINNHGLSTQDTLQLHLGYTNFYVWEVVDARDPAQRFTTRIGWVTSPKTRPLILTDFYEAITTVDATTGERDLQINSTWTMEDMANLIIPEGGRIGDAEAAPGCYDDCVMSGAIGHYVVWRRAGGEREPLSEQRRRHRMSVALRARSLQETETAADFRNMAYTADETTTAERQDERTLITEELEELMDVRGVAYLDD